MAKPKVLVTGASGLIGGLTIRGLGDQYEFSGLSRHPVEGIPYTIGDIRDLDAGPVAHRRAWTWCCTSPAEPRTTTTGTTTCQSPPAATMNVFRAAQEAGVWRIVCHEQRQHDVRLGVVRLLALRQAGARGEFDRLRRWELLDYRTRRDPTALRRGKLFGEEAGRWFSDRTPMSVLCIRLGAVLPVEPARADPPLPRLPRPGRRRADDRQVPERAGRA